MGSKPRDRSADSCVTNRRETVKKWRAMILDCLRDLEEPISVDDLGATIIERDPEPAVIDEPEVGDPFEQVQIRLHHIDLPILADEGYLEYDPKQWIVSSW